LPRTTRTNTKNKDNFVLSFVFSCGSWFLLFEFHVHAFVVGKFTKGEKKYSVREKSIVSGGAAP
ncbi:MAG: hypothetical protein LBN21_04995, partial [Treponema sp.]|nr:hypothetical protein [Treponema sp.]